MRGFGRLLSGLLRGPEQTFGCLVFVLGGFSLATWPVAGVGPILTLITLLLIVTGLTLFWRDVGWFRRVWGGGLMLAVAAAVIAMLNPDTPHGAMFQIVAWLALLPAVLAVIGYAHQQWIGHQEAPVLREGSQAVAGDADATIPPPLPRPQRVADAVPPPLPRPCRASGDAPATEPNESAIDLPPPLSRRIAETDLLEHLLNIPPEQSNGD
ncbi:hypothetical protein [Chloroflexus sp.]|uniref:hypothetical protein n=1 Tax=Chloroflexus sp. TaxID=1904827 RepID=UPI002ADDD2DF|nr:hypothetical protein [Chloroflexus sp.]